MANSKVVRAAMSSVLNTEKEIGKAIKVYPNSSLNQKLSIFPDAVPEATDHSETKYVIIGNGGHSFELGSNNRVLYKALHHLPRHTALYNQLPFVLRLPENDLTATERLRYRLRRIETHGGVKYVAYYARVLDYSSTDVSLELRHVEDGVTTAQVFSPTLEDINPQPPVLLTGEKVETSADYIATTAKAKFTMSAADVEDFLQAVEIIEGTRAAALISETASVSGIERVMEGDFSGTLKNYDEIIYARITNFIATGWPMEFQTSGITLNIDIGNVEPLTNIIS